MSRLVPNSFQISNVIVDDLLSSLTGNELKCYLLIVRKTRGWHKECDSISVSQFQEATGISNRVVIEACKSLVEKGLIIQKSGARNISVFAINDEPKMTTTSDEKSHVTKSHTLRKVTSDENDNKRESLNPCGIPATSDEKSHVTKSHTHKDNIYLLKNKDKKTSSATKEKTFAEYQADCLAERKDLIPDGSEPEKVAEKLELSAEMVEVFWHEFQSVHLDLESKSSKKRQADWPKTIANYLRKNYFELWGFDRETGLPYWTQKGRSIWKAMDAEVAA